MPREWPLAHALEVVELSLRFSKAEETNLSFEEPREDPFNFYLYYWYHYYISHPLIYQ